MCPSFLALGSFLMLSACAPRTSPARAVPPGPPIDTSSVGPPAPDSGERPEDTAADTAVDSAPPEPVDADGDGASVDVDCDDANASVYPGADDACGGEDLDCDPDACEPVVFSFDLDMSWEPSSYTSR